MGPGFQQARSGGHPACRIGRLPAVQTRARCMFFGRDARPTPTESELDAALREALIFCNVIERGVILARGGPLPFDLPVTYSATTPPASRPHPEDKAGSE